MMVKPPVLLLAAVLALLAGPAGAAPALVVRFSHVVAEDTPKGQAALRFKALVEQRSAHRIRVDVYPLSSLYDDQDEMLALQLGAVEILAPSLSKFGKFGFPSFELFDLPFLFRNLDEVHRITQGRVGRALLDELSRQQFIGLGYMDNGFKHMSANRQLLAPADYQGLRMRIQPSRIIAAQMQALGARPIPLALSETRKALERGVVDGTENPLSNFVTQRIHEVQTDISLTNHGYLGYAVVANQRFWKALGAPDRAMLQQAMAEALAYGNEISASQEQRALSELKATGRTRINPLSDTQREALRAAVLPVYDSARSRIGGALLSRTLDEVADLRQQARPNPQPGK